MLGPIRPTVPTTRFRLCSAIALAVLCTFPEAVAGAAVRGGSDTVRVAVIVGPDSARSADFRRGVELGSAEGAVLAKLLGRELITSVFLASDAASFNSYERTLTTLGVAAVVAFADSATTASLTRFVSPLGIPLINAGTRSNAFRGALCSPVLFHVSPSEAMLRDALRVAGARSPGDSASVTAWHGRLERFGAGELNDRYRSRFGADATEDAWLGWIAMKIVAETALRSPTVKGRDVLARLHESDPRFDGHKGKPLTFRAWDGQLRQPLYVHSARDTSLRVRELPEDSSGSTETASDHLDKLGETAASTACRGRR